jgi:hypothetical protein
MNPIRLTSCFACWAGWGICPPIHPSIHPSIMPKHILTSRRSSRIQEIPLPAALNTKKPYHPRTFIFEARQYYRISRPSATTHIVRARPGENGLPPLPTPVRNVQAPLISRSDAEAGTGRLVANGPMAASALLPPSSEHICSMMKSGVLWVCNGAKRGSGK